MDGVFYADETRRLRIWFKLLGLYAIVGVPVLVVGSLVALWSRVGGSAAFFFGLSLLLVSVVLLPHFAVVRRLSMEGKREAKDGDKPRMERTKELDQVDMLFRSPAEWFAAGLGWTSLTGILTVGFGIANLSVIAGVHVGAPLPWGDYPALVVAWFASASAILYLAYMVAGRRLSCPSCNRFRAAERHRQRERKDKRMMRELGFRFWKERVEDHYKCKYCAHEWTRIWYDIEGESAD